MTINDQLRDEKLQYDIDRETAKIWALSSEKIHKYKHLTGEDMLPSNHQQTTEQGKFTYSPLGKTFEKQIKTIEDQGQKQVDALKDLKPREQIQPTEGKSTNESKATIVFNYLINKRKNKMNELYDNVDYNNLKFEYVDPTKDVSFYEYMNSKKLFNKIKNNQIRFNNLLKRQNEFLNKLSDRKKTRKQKQLINNLEILPF